MLDIFGRKPQLEKVADGFYLKKLTGKDYVDLVSLFDEVERDDKDLEGNIKVMAECCHIGIVDKKGKQIHESADDWVDEPFEILDVCADAVIAPFKKVDVEASD